MATALALARLRSAERLAGQLLASAAAAIDALAAPLDAYDEAVGRLAGDPLLEQVLADLRRATGGRARRGGGVPGARGGADGQRSARAAASRPQAPVSFRVAPQELAQLRRTLGRLDEDVRRALVAVTDSPAVVGGRALAGGGFHAVGLAAGWTRPRWPWSRRPSWPASACTACSTAASAGCPTSSAPTRAR